MKKKNPNSIHPSNDLFSASEEEVFQDSPLSARMRPRTLSEYVGQGHIVGHGKMLVRALEADRLTSIILYGPPGCGKTTLANCISRQIKTHFEKINAVSSNVDELRKIILSAQNRRYSSRQRTVLFIDEIHRFNKAQQDVLMPDVEDGTIILIGATVFNPFFSLTSPLVSRSLVFELKPLSQDEIITILNNALADKHRGLGNYEIEIDEKVLKFIADSSEGDARRALNALEIACLSSLKGSKAHLTIDVAQESIQKKYVQYDKDGDEHYDTISAFIKSMRGSDPDAALYWMAKMIYAGEDPRFIARRICICAAEDVGNADPQALVLSSAALQIAEFVGMPEARIPLAQAAVYVACAPKSNAAYVGIDKALDDVKNKRSLKVPTHLRDGHYPGAKKLGHGEGYKYAHDYPGGHVPQEYMPSQERYYIPTEIGYEKKIKDRLDVLLASMKNPAK